MGSRIPFSIPLALAGWEDVDIAIAELGIAGSVTRTFMNVLGAPSGSDLIIDIRNALADGGSGHAVTIADGENSETDTTTLVLGASDLVYLRVEQHAGAMNLSGWFEFESAAAAGATSFLTTLAIVKVDEGISGAGDDAPLTRLIAGISKAMQLYMGRGIVDTTHADEVHSATGLDSELLLEHYPITATQTLGVKLEDVAIDTDLYTQDDESGILHKVGSRWTRGTRHLKATYSSGFTSVPADLVMAATAQVRHEWHQLQPSGPNRLGVTASVAASGGRSEYAEHNWLPMVEAVMQSYVRRAA